MNFVLGVNYWPRKKAMYWWKRFEKGEVKEEFEIIKELGLDLVRFFLLWEDFQSSPEEVSQERLNELSELVAVAEDVGLMLMPSFFIGHMSGVNWLPRWLLDESPNGRFMTYSSGVLIDRGAINIYEDRRALEAEEVFLTEVIREIGDSHAVHSWDISNEIDNVLVPRSPRIASKWTEFIADTIRRADRHRRPVTFGTHQEDIELDKGFRIPVVSPHLDYLSMHAYSVYSDFTDPLDTYFVPFACVLTRELGGKDVLMQEFGMPVGEGPTRMIRSATGKVTSMHYLINESEASNWLERTLHKLYVVGVRGALYWNFSDYHESLWNMPPLDRAVHERFFGLLKSNGKPKETAFVFKRFRKAIEDEPPERINVGLELPEDYYSNPKDNMRWLYSRFVETWMGMNMGTGTGANNR